jgi:hypothetical protein
MWKYDCIPIVIKMQGIFFSRVHHDASPHGLCCCPWRVFSGCSFYKLRGLNMRIQTEVSERATQRVETTFQEVEV